MQPQQHHQHKQHKHEDIRALAQVKQTPSKATHTLTWHGSTMHLFTLYLAFLGLKGWLFSYESEEVVRHHGSLCFGDVGLETCWSEFGTTQRGPRWCFGVFFPRIKGIREKDLSPRKPKLATQKGACVKKIPPAKSKSQRRKPQKQHQQHDHNNRKHRQKRTKNTKDKQ